MTTVTTDLPDDSPQGPGPGRRVVRIATATALLQVAMWSVALCADPLGWLLDEGLQRALLSQYATHSISGYPARENVSSLASLTAPAIDCDRVIDTIARKEPDSAPPTVAPDALLAELGRGFVRWYLIHVDVGPASFDRISEALRLTRSLYRYPLYSRATFTGSTCPRAALNATACPGTGSNPYDPGARPPFADEVHAFPSLGVFLVRVSTITQFQTLLEHVRREPSARIMENYPLEPALGNVPSAIGLVSNHQLHGATGEGMAIAILDTGVNAEYFTELVSVDGVETWRSRIVYQACFSSTELLGREGTGGLEQDTYSEPLCSEGNTIDDTWEFALPGPDLATPHYRPVSTAGGEGEGCVGSILCGHGTRVAYIAAGNDPSGLMPNGLAPGARVIAIQVASRFPPSMCGGPHSCAKVVPLDALRALHHVRQLLDVSPDVFGGAELVAVNMSVQTLRWCDAWSDRLEPPACTAHSEAGSWAHASYAEPCDNGFSRLVDSLLAKNVHTVIAAGNRDLHSEEDSGVVSLPGCVGSAVTVGATEGPPDYRRLWHKSMIGTTVDLLAPGHDILTAPYPSPIAGTSYAAPVVSGVLALIRQALGPCGAVDPGLELQRLLERRIAITYPKDRKVPWSVPRNLGIDLTSMPLACPS